jgi:predicted kinase
MALWNIVLSGYPSSGKTKLAQRLVSDNRAFIRLSVDDLRAMYFGPKEPPKEEEFVYNTLATLRDATLASQRSVVIDSTAPRNETREFLLGTRISNVTELLVLVMAEKGTLADRNRDRGMVGAVEAWDKVWENPSKNIPIMKFRNNSPAEFETSYYVLTDLLRSEVHPYKRRFLADIYPRILGGR